MDEETLPENTETSSSPGKPRAWRRMGVLSARMMQFAAAFVVLRLLQMALQHGRTEAGLLMKCLGVAALLSFVTGTVLGDLWVAREIMLGRSTESSGECPEKMGPVLSMLLTGRLHSAKTASVRRDILAAKALLLLCATLVSALLLVALWLSV